MKRVLHVLTWVFAVFWIGFAGLSMAYVIAAGRSPNGPELFGYRFMMVLSDSMTPAIHSGDLVVGRRPATDQLKTGQVVTYMNHVSGRMITHRIQEVKQIGSETAVIVKGDANNLPDQNPVFARDVVSLYSFRIPYMGYLFSFARGWQGLVVLVIIPSLLMMGSELIRLIRLFKADQKRAQAE